MKTIDIQFGLKHRPFVQLLRISLESLIDWLHVLYMFGSVILQRRRPASNMPLLNFLFGCYIYKPHNVARERTILGSASASLYLFVIKTFRDSLVCCNNRLIKRFHWLML